MDAAGSSNLRSRCTIRAPESGIVIEEPIETITVSNNSDNLDQQQIFMRNADQYMPIANIIKIMRHMLPPHAKVADDAKETIQECVSEFISFVTTQANAKCNEEYRRIITPGDVISAMGTLGFTNYVEPLNNYLDKICSQDVKHNSAQHTQSVKRNVNFVQNEPQVTRPQPTSHAPLTSTLTTNNVGSSQTNDYHIHNASGNGQESSSNLGFGPYRHFK